MTFKKHFVKAALVLLLLALVTGMGDLAAAAGDEPGSQLVLVLDPARAPVGDQGQNILPQAASLVVHLLKEQDYLGLAATGQDEGVIAPPGRLTQEHRTRILGKLAGFAPGPQETPFTKVLTQALRAIKPEGPTPRFLLVLSDQIKRLDSQAKAALLEEDKQIADLARKTGVAIYGGALGPELPSDELKFVTAATGGRFWGGADSHGPVCRGPAVLSGGGPAPGGPSNGVGLPPGRVGQAGGGGGDAVGPGAGCGSCRSRRGPD